MTITYENVNPSLIANTTMRKLLVDGEHRTYNIAPVPGYVLHDKENDWEDGGVLYRGYASGTVSCAASYDFTTNPREFYAVPESDVPADQIFGGGNHEVASTENGETVTE